MDDIFRTYNAPLIIEGVPGFTAERWNGLEAWSKTAELGQIPELIEALYGVGAIPGSLAELFQAHDETLVFVAGSPATRQLSAAAMDYLFSRTRAFETPAALSVLTAAFGDRLPLGLSVDIVARAAQEIDDIADFWRTRQPLTTEIAAIAPEALASKLIAEITKSFEADKTVAAINDVLKVVGKSLDKVALSTRVALKNVETRLDQTDEETNVLWFVFAGESNIAKQPFSELPPAKAALYAAFEMAEITRQPLHSRTFGALLHRLGVATDPIVLTAAIEELSPATITEKVSREPSVRLMPVHRLMDRFREFGSAGGAWSDGVKEVLGFAPDLEVGAHDLALQVYRERLLQKALKL